MNGTTAIFEKNLTALQSGLKALDSINKGFEKLAKQDKKLKLFDKTNKALTQVQKALKKISKSHIDMSPLNQCIADMERHSNRLNFDNATNSLRRFNTILKTSHKQLNTITKGLKGLGLAGLAGGGAIAGAGAMLANFGKGFISNDFNAKAFDIKGFGGRSYQALQNMSELTTGNKDYLAGLVAHVRNGMLNAENSAAYASLGINQADFAKLSFDKQLQVLLDKSKDSIFDELYADVWRNDMEKITGLNIGELRALAKEIPNVTQAFNTALSGVASSENIQKMENLGKEYAKMQHSLEAFAVDSASGVNSGLTNAIKGISEGVNELRNDKGYQGMLKAFNGWLGANVNKNSIKETINNLPALIMDTRSAYNSITSFFNSVSGESKGLKNDLNDLFAKIGITDKTDKDTKHSELQDKFNAIADKIISLESAITSSETRLRNVVRYGGNIADKTKYEKELQDYKKELKEKQELKIKFELQHEYINGQWQVKEKVGEKDEKTLIGNFFNGLMVLAQ